MQFSVQVVLAVIASATGTLLVLGVLGFCFCMIYRKSNYFHPILLRKVTTNNDNPNQPNLSDTTPNETSSALTLNNDFEEEDQENDDDDDDLNDNNHTRHRHRPLPNNRNNLKMDSNLTITSEQNQTPQVLPDDDTTTATESQSCCNNDDNWSYAVTEDGSVLIAQPCPMRNNNHTNHPSNHRTHAKPVYYHDQDCNSVMYEV